MTTSRFSLLFVLAALASTLTGCAAIGDIFKTGLWAGVIGVFIVVAIVFWLVSKIGGNKGGGAS